MKSEFSSSWLEPRRNHGTESFQVPEFRIIHAARRRRNAAEIPENLLFKTKHLCRDNSELTQQNSDFIFWYEGWTSLSIKHLQSVAGNDFLRSEENKGVRSLLWILQTLDGR
jgi:hypothetical protein